MKTTQVDKNYIKGLVGLDPFAIQGLVRAAERLTACFQDQRTRELPLFYHLNEKGCISQLQQALATLKGTEMRTTVVNLKRDRYDIYIGRAGRGQTGEFGNPYQIGPNRTREKSVAMFRLHFYGRIRNEPEFRAKIEAMRGKRLGCFCKPLACHGDVYVEWLESLPNNDAAHSR